MLERAFPRRLPLHLATEAWTTALFTDHVLCAFGRAMGTWEGEGSTRTVPATGRWLTKIGSERLRRQAVALQKCVWMLNSW